MLLYASQHKQFLVRIITVTCCVILSGCIPSGEEESSSEKKQVLIPESPVRGESIQAPLIIQEPPLEEIIEDIPVAPPPPPKFNVEISWQLPNKREDGQYIEELQITGVEILYREINDDEYRSILYRDSIPEQQIIPELDKGQYEITLAVIDEHGVYSEYSDPMYVVLGDALN